MGAAGTKSQDIKDRSGKKQGNKLYKKIILSGKGIDASSVIDIRFIYRQCLTILPRLCPNYH